MGGQSVIQVLFIKNGFASKSVGPALQTEKFFI